jgi:hypothetical protein
MFIDFCKLARMPVTTMSPVAAWSEGVEESAAGGASCAIATAGMPAIARTETPTNSRLSEPALKLCINPPHTFPNALSTAFVENVHMSFFDFAVKPAGLFAQPT